MARAEIESTPLDLEGVAPDPTTGTADGHFFANPPVFGERANRFVRVENTAVAARDIILQTGAKIAGFDVQDLVVEIPAESVRLLGPFPIVPFNREAGEDNPGTIYLDYHEGEEGDLKVEVYTLPI